MQIEMAAAPLREGARGSALGATAGARVVRAWLPALSLGLVLAAIAYLNPRAISYFGFNLMLNLAIPIVAAVAIATIVHFGLMRTSYGAILRGSGGNPAALARAGWSLLKTKVFLFALAGFFGVLSGLTLISITTSADANIGSGYTLLSIAGVILG